MGVIGTGGIDVDDLDAPIMREEQMEVQHSHHPEPDRHEVGKNEDENRRRHLEVDDTSFEGDPEKKYDDGPQKREVMAPYPTAHRPPRLPQRSFERRKSASLDGSAITSNSFVPAKHTYAQRSNSARRRKGYYVDGRLTPREITRNRSKQIVSQT
ncbi:hypothetical protein BS47DRAFT_1400896 [Hydnum rufescens UP504]|uniref:Uncharacterized protein n=1 Tax=Hydnum rufescens UP504 TaxID=1448309 RepID=A0A9P6AHA6_9AGAM|nr:hypothetical protein BS47DRAFT_1400896 [Hydnum rufescens UP504]